MHNDHRDELAEEREAARRATQDRLDRMADHAPAVTSIHAAPSASRERAAEELKRSDRLAERISGERPAIDVDELERQHAAAGPRERVYRLHPNPAELTPPAPRVVMAGDFVDELERQHRRAYRRRQEAAARRRRRRQALEYGRDLLVMALLAGAGGVVIVAIGVMFARGM